MSFVLAAVDGRRVAVNGGSIVPDDDPSAFVVELGDGEIGPGLINGHDHLHRNHYARLGAPPYANAYDWGDDIHARNADAIVRAAALDRRDALLFGAFKNLVSGATTVVHHDPWESAFENGFPVHVPRVRVAHSLRLETDIAARVAGDQETAGAPLCVHLAEGIDTEAADEIREAKRLGVLDERLVAVHVVGADDDGVDRLVRARATVAWCPTSNAFLFGRTAPRTLVASAASVVLGSDSLLTGDGTLLDELAVARRLGYVDDATLAAAVGCTAARVFGLAKPSLNAGSGADIVCLRRPLLEASLKDVALVIARGRPVVGDPECAALFAHCGVDTDVVVVRGKRTLIDASIARVIARVLRAFPEAGRFLS